MNYNHLVIVLGPSGSGKDTLISGTKSILANDPDFHFITREITRPSVENDERHIETSEESFHHRRDAGAYAIYWHAHDTWYGITQKIEDYLAEGKVVVFNGSRAALDEAKKRFPDVKIIFISTPKDILTERLIARGRESDIQVKERIDRNTRLNTIPEDAIVLSNEGTLQQTLNEFLEILQKILADESKPVIDYTDRNHMKQSI